MNKKGQTLIFFVLLIPIFVTLMAVIVDVGVMRYTYQNTKSIVSDGIRMYLKDKDIATLKEVLEDNGLEKEEYVIKEEDAKVLDDKFGVQEPKKKNTKIWFTVILGVILFPTKIIIYKVSKNINNPIMNTRRFLFLYLNLLILYKYDKKRLLLK